jgi:hypothetical protein
MIVLPKKERTLTERHRAIPSIEISDGQNGALDSGAIKDV